MSIEVTTAGLSSSSNVQPTSGPLLALGISGNLYSYSYSTVLTTSGSEVSIGILKNPVANTKSLYLISVLMSNHTSAAGIALRVYKNPTITANGTAAVIQPQIIGGSQVASVMQLFVPTGIGISNNGTSLVAGLSTLTPIPNGSTFPIIAPSVNTFLITAVPFAASQTLDLTLIWAEI